MGEDEKRAYSRGYAAGKKRAALSEERERRMVLREQFEREVFIAALPAIMAGNWTHNGERVSSAKGYANVAADFSREASRYFSFPLPPATAKPEEVGHG